MSSPRHIASWRQWIEPWYLSYAALGAAAAGLAPILLPLAVSAGGSLAQAGLVIACYNLGGLAAPAWGTVADHTRLYRPILLVGLAMSAIAFAAFPFVTSLPARMLLALVQGAGAAAPATVGNMLIIEVHPKNEWDRRIGWLQTFYAAGQVAGLLLAGWASGLSVTIGFTATAGLAALAVVPALLVRTPGTSTQIPRPVLLRPAHHTEFLAGSPQHHHHRFHGSLRTLVHAIHSPLGGFLAAWCFSFAGAAGYFSLYPVLMQTGFGISPTVAALAFAVAATVGLALYPPAGKWSDRFGPRPVMQAGLIIRLAAFAGLFLLGLFPTSVSGTAALVAFLLIVVAWSLLSVAGTALTASLASQNEGEGLGLFNATGSIAGVIGSIAGGWIAAQWGSGAVAMLGVAGISIGFIILRGIGPSPRTETPLQQHTFPVAHEEQL